VEGWRDAALSSKQRKHSCNDCREAEQEEDGTGKGVDVGMYLKCDEMIDFLELYDLSVEYHFDRLHEGQSDSYSVESKDPAIDLLFDAEQRCTTIFVRDPDAALKTVIVAFPNLRSPKQVEEHAQSNRLVLRRGPSWLRCDESVC